MAALRAAQTQILELQMLQPDLEEVFVKIMRGAESLEPASV
jgi:ABC-2 type transport system ATP-binding protein